MLLVFRMHLVTPSNKILLWVAIVGKKTVIDHYVRVPNAKLVYTQFSGNLHLFEIKLCLPVWRVWSDSGVSIMGFIFAWCQKEQFFSCECKWRISILLYCHKLLMVKNGHSRLSFTNFAIVFNGEQCIWINRFIQHIETDTNGQYFFKSFSWMKIVVLWF